MTYLQERTRWITILKQELCRARVKSSATKKDIGVVLDDYIRGDGNYKLSQNTKLYINYGGEYCQLLEFLNYINSEGKFKNLKELSR